MARPISEGLSYFCHDVDMSSDEKVELLEARHGLEGYAIYNKLLERIFRSGGFFGIVLPETLKILSNKFKVTESNLIEVISSCVEFGLFDKEMYEKKLLTSRGIAKRAKSVYDNRLNNRAKGEIIVLTETEKQFYNYLKETPKQRKNKSKRTDIVKESKVNNNNSSFEAFWKLYDKKVGRSKAMLEWSKLSEEEIQTAMDYIPKYKSSKEKQFRKDPERFLKHKCWNDEIVSPEPKNGTEVKHTGYVIDPNKFYGR